MIHFSCTKIPQDPGKSDKNQLNSHPSSQSIIFAEDSEQLLKAANDIAKDMAENAPEIIAILTQDQAECGSFEDLNLHDRYPMKVRIANSFTAEWHLEKSILSKTTLKEGTAVLFAPDPDNFKPDEKENICDAFLWDNGKVSAISFSSEEYTARLSNIPLYLISYVGFSDQFEQTLKKVTGNGEDYAVLYAFKQKKKMDTWGNMEIKITTQDYSGQGYHDYTGYIFDGRTHYDAAGRSKYFPDVNTAGSKYNISGGIAIVYAGGSNNHGWLVEEDDDGPMDTFNHERAYPYPDPYLNIAYFYATVDVNPANTGRIDNQQRTIWHNIYTEWQNDDIATSGAYEGYDSSWNLSYGVRHEEALDDNHFWLEKENID